jgi:hypothetical protein
VNSYWWLPLEVQSFFIGPATAAGPNSIPANFSRKSFFAADLSAFSAPMASTAAPNIIVKSFIVDSDYFEFARGRFPKGLAADLSCDGF